MNIQQSKLSNQQTLAQEAIAKAIAEPMQESTIAEILKRADDAEMLTVQAKYLQMLDSEVQLLVSKTRHRAAMLRERAAQLDGEADQLERATPTVIKANVDLADKAAEVEDMLRSLVHIEPHRVREKGDGKNR